MDFLQKMIYLSSRLRSVWFLFMPCNFRMNVRAANIAESSKEYFQLSCFQWVSLFLHRQTILKYCSHC